MIKRAWLVTTSKGDAVFLAEQYSRAEEYASKHHGTLMKLYGQTSDNGTGGGQTGQSAVTGTEQLHENPSDAGEVCNTDWPIRENVLTC